MRPGFKRLTQHAISAQTKRGIGPLTLHRKRVSDWVRSQYLQSILSARVYDVAKDTPLQYASVLSSQINHEVFLKREDLQPVFSFKIRGAYNCMANLPQEKRDAGVVACSAGNHAQGVALSATRLGINATIIMPTATPTIKVNAVRSHGGNVVLHGDNYDEAQEEALRLVREEKRTLIHPFDNPYVISGQGTIAMEIIKERNGKSLDAIFVCCGGGGMLAGIASYVKAVRPDVKVIGVEADDAAGMTVSLRNGKVTPLDEVGAFADGAAVRVVGQETFRVCRELVDEMITVSTDEICAAIKTGFNDTRSVLEPAGALGIAGVQKYAKKLNNRIHALGLSPGDESKETYAVITSGANMDFDRLRFVSERADATETFISVLIPERPGSFQELYSKIFPRNVTSFSYRYKDDTDAYIFMSFQSSDGAEDVASVIEDLDENGYIVTNLSTNEMAKVHGRYLCGGRSSHAEDTHHELLYRFEFPERPGALKLFLDTLSQGNSGWNVSLFHYRYHGADIGRVLVGVQVPSGKEDQWQEFLNDLGYVYHNEQDNRVYRQFLK